MTQGYFITGTDTGTGKTRVSVALLRQLSRSGYKVAGMKPVASGCEMTADGLRNDDAIQLINNSSVDLDYPIVNPYAFLPPVAPHLAARQSGVSIDKNVILTACQAISHQVDAVIVEGVGGWLVPINATETMADVARCLSLPVILVVGIRLGCLNHALLTVAAIKQSGLPLAGWVANRIDEQCLLIAENIDCLQQSIQAPMLADIPWMVPAADHPEIVLPE